MLNTARWSALLQAIVPFGLGCLLMLRFAARAGQAVRQRQLDRLQLVAERYAAARAAAEADLRLLQAFDAGAVDYLVKPLDPARLAQTVARLRQGLQRPAPANDALQQLLAQLDERARRPAWPDTLQAGVGKEVRMIRVDDVIYFESDSRYTRVVYVEAGEPREALLRTPLKDLLALLDPVRFQQVRRSVVVAAAQIASAVRDDDGGMVLRLRGAADTLPVSRPFQSLFKGQ